MRKILLLTTLALGACQPHTPVVYEDQLVKWKASQPALNSPDVVCNKDGFIHPMTEYHCVQMNGKVVRAATEAESMAAKACSVGCQEMMLNSAIDDLKRISYRSVVVIIK